MHLAIASCFGKRFQIEFRVRRNHREAKAVHVAANEQRLEDFLVRHANLVSYEFGFEVLGIDLIVAQFVFDAESIELAGSVCLAHA